VYQSVIFGNVQHLVTEPINLILFHEHYFLLYRATVKQFSCDNCGIRNIVNIKKHVCNLSRTSYFQTKVKRQIRYCDKRPEMNSSLSAKSHLWQNIVFYDFETFFDGTKHHVYAVGLLHWKEDGSKTYVDFYGAHALESFMMFLEEMHKQAVELTLVSYNGSNFDHYFVLEHQVRYNNADLDEFLLNKGRLLQINFWGHKVLDLYNFLGPSSLDANCVSYQIPLRKSVFPHLYPRSWTDIEYVGPTLPEEMYPEKMRADFRSMQHPDVFNFRIESLKYLQIDVECLQLLGERFMNEMYNQFNIYLPFYLTLSQVAFELWKTTLDPLWSIPIPSTPQLYDVVNKATYGGRCHFVKRHFLSSQVSELCYEKIQDYLVDLDVVSLYPASMMNLVFPCGDVNFDSDMINMIELESDFYSNKEIPIGIYHVSVIPPTHMIVVPIPQKNSKGLTTWSLHGSDSQYYTSVDLEIGRRYGYSFKFLSAFTWTDKQPLFTGYISDIFQRKAEQDILKKNKSQDYNPAAREVFKKLMNALYGKMMQKRQHIDHDFIDPDDETQHEKWTKFLNGHSGVEYHPIGQQIMMMTGDNNDFKKSISKPHYLGAFILSYSRAMMNGYFDLIDPYRVQGPIYDWQKSLESSFYYTDTDSLIVHADRLPLVSEHIGTALGKLADELNGGKIIEGYFLSPKLYCVRYMLPDGSIHEKLRAKGIPNHMLTVQAFKNMYFDNDPTRFDFVQLRRIQQNLNAPQETKGMEPFTIVSVLDAHRTLNASGMYGEMGTFGGRVVCANICHSVPLGFKKPEEDLQCLEDESFDVENQQEKEDDLMVSDTELDWLYTALGDDVWD
jgi:hypothetical protein